MEMHRWLLANASKQGNEFHAVQLSCGDTGAIVASAPPAFLVGRRHSFFWWGAFMIIRAVVNPVFKDSKPKGDLDE